MQELWPVRRGLGSRAPSWWVQDPSLSLPEVGPGLTWHSFEFSSEEGIRDTLERTELGRTHPQGLRRDSTESQASHPIPYSQL